MMDKHPINKPLKVRVAKEIETETRIEVVVQLGKVGTKMTILKDISNTRHHRRNPNIKRRITMANIIRSIIRRIRAR